MILPTPKTTKSKRKEKWIRKWYVPSKTGKAWVVAVDDNENFGCSCPIWRFSRKECHHIKEVKENLFINIMNYTIHKETENDN